MIVLCLRCSRKIIYRRKFRERRREELITRTRLDGELLSPVFFPLKLGSGRMRSDYLFYIFLAFYFPYSGKRGERRGGTCAFKELFKLKFTVAQLCCLRCAICYIMTCCISSYSTLVDRQPPSQRMHSFEAILTVNFLSGRKGKRGTELHVYSE